MFVAGHQIGSGSYLVEYEIDWTKLMEIVLKTFEEGDNSIQNIIICLNNILGDYVKNANAEKEVRDLGEKKRQFENDLGGIRKDIEDVQMAVQKASQEKSNKEHKDFGAKNGK